MPGRRRVTSADVARLAGVSRATVSLVLNEVPNSRIPAATAETVRAAAEQLDFQFSHAARALVRGKADVLIALLPSFSVAVAQIEAMSELAAESARLGYVYLPVFVTGDDADDAARLTAICDLVAPVAATTLLPVSTDLAAVLERHAVRLVGVRDGAVLTLALDEEMGAAQAGALLAAGCRSLGYLWPEQDGQSPFAERRAAGVSRVVAEAGLPVVQVVSVGDAVSFDAAVTSLAGVDGVAAFDDTCAIAFLAAASRARLAPPLIIGVDDSPLAALITPTLSTVHPRRGLVRMLVQQLQSELAPAGREPAPTEELVAVILRESTRPR